ncbi:hypothetical protein QRE66_29905 (plasmid) [Bacillus cereus]|uniref:hypothetical protein n=1 Tax=Bacillus pseudomycoides TaxID=64104 RepID=UPI001F0AC998|nr:hypothetical protein [Bacillus pseudomycoides]WJE55749.1 hypothetical protein QRE66_29905 [Bacillus cereus]
MKKKILVSTLCSLAILSGGTTMAGAQTTSGKVSSTDTINTANPASIIQTNYNTQGKSLIASETLVASVTSAPTPMDGQKNRSSGNFSIQNLPENTYALKWVIVGASDGIRFNVMRDVSAGKDPVIWNNIYSGNSTDVKTHRSFYISNPSGASGNFTVNVYAIH